MKYSPLAFLGLALLIGCPSPSSSSGGADQPASSPTFGLSPGAYTSDQTVSLSSLTTGASIHYTTDGSTPTSSSSLYSVPITVAGPSTKETIKAIASKSGYSASTVASATYTVETPYSWTNETTGKSSSGVGWYAVASSADGTHLIAGASVAVWTSTDSGATWTNQNIAFPSSIMASNSDGTHVIVTGSGGDLYTGVLSGSTWTWTDQQTATGGPGSKSWHAVAENSDGTRVVAVVNSGDIYTGVFSGSTWTWTDHTTPGSKAWYSVASNSAGTQVVAGAYGGDIWVGNYNGTSWTWSDQTTPGSNAWYSLSSSADGTHIASAVWGGDVWAGTYSGSSWSWTDETNSGSRLWYSVAVSDDGTHLAGAVSSGDLWTSTDSGTTWVDQTGPSQGAYWKGIASSSSGTKLVAVVDAGDIWTGQQAP